MANHDELERLGERFPNKNIGGGNPNAKILVVTQKELSVSPLFNMYSLMAIICRNMTLQNYLG